MLHAALVAMTTAYQYDTRPRFNYGMRERLKLLGGVGGRWARCRNRLKEDLALCGLRLPLSPRRMLPIDRMWGRPPPPPSRRCEYSSCGVTDMTQRVPFGESLCIGV